MISPTKEQRRQLARENANYPEYLIPIPRDQWLPVGWDKTDRVEVWRSRRYLVQIFAVKDGAERITVSRTKMTGNTWQDGISWDDLQRLKHECGRGEKWAVEIFPSNLELVNVANMRHLFVLDEAPAFAWRNQSSTASQDAQATHCNGYSRHTEGK